MFSLSDMAIFLLLSTLCYSFYSAVRVREIALFKVQRYLSQQQLQLLDQSVAFKAVWFKRDSQGKLQFWRSYKFEFSSLGDERYRGLVIMLGSSLDAIELEPYRIEKADDVSSD